MSLKPLKIFFFSIEATGHQSACLGLAQVLLQRGHQVYFLITEPFRGQMQKYGCTELILENPNKSDLNSTKKEVELEKAELENPIKALAEVLLSQGFLGPKNSLEKMRIMCNEAFVKDTYDKAVLYAPAMEQAIQKEKPDLIILDHFLLLPVVLKSKIPYVQSFSGNPLFLYNSPEKLPPSCSGKAKIIKI